MLLCVVMVYQLGVCPCGCLEHNAWAQLIGLDAHVDGNQRAVDDQESCDMDVVTRQDDHDCDGRAQEPYFNNTRSPLVQEAFAAEDHFSSVVVFDRMTREFVVARARQRMKSFESAAAFAAALRPALQVYRL